MSTASPKQEKPGLWRRLTRWFRHVNTRSTLLIVVFGLAALALLYAAITPKRYDLRVGTVSRHTITATRDVEDTVATEEKKKAAANAVEPTYIFQEGASEEVLQNLSEVFTELRTVQQYGLTLRGDLTERELRSHTFEDAELEYAQNLVTLMPLTRYQATTLLRTSTEDYDNMVTYVTQAVENSLNTMIREGTVPQSISTIQQIVGYRVEISLYQNIVPSVLRLCVKPNMIIDQASTETAREAVMATVEPVMLLQGENIVLEGERVTASQVAMLKTLGLLEGEAGIDWTVYLGGALLVLAVLIHLRLMVRLVAKHILQDLRKAAVLSIVLALSFGISYALSTFVNAYLSTTVLASMLLAALLGHAAASACFATVPVLTAVFAVGISSGFSADTLAVLLAGLISSVVCIRFLMGKPQRTRMLLCGLVAAATSAVTVLATGLLSSLPIDSVRINTLWVAAGGAISALIAVGLQPLFEAVFNLATPSKLLELSNPNQPLLRRLLLEASGTYHHSIVVANLAEAAAEKIGANPLLARTAAYYHDIGKLKRPLYFKENQMGVNPHDNADPRISAAILTSHTRDGYQLAQKYRLPREIQQIILEHHGDTPVMYFYHKATQQANGKPVDIADFRYAGPRPSTKESTVVMLADTVEAAVRSMSTPTPERIEEFIIRLVRGKLEDGQLSDSPITLQDIDGICSAFCQVLHGVFHERIEYPDVKLPARPLHEDAAPAEPKAPEAPKAADEPKPPVVPKAEPKEELKAEPKEAPKEAPKAEPKEEPKPEPEEEPKETPEEEPAAAPAPAETPAAEAPAETEHTDETAVEH